MGRNRVDFDSQLGKSFKVVTTPPSAAKNYRTGETLPDDPNRYSIVTPENGDRWNWPVASPEAHADAKKRFDKLFTDRRTKYKGRQIRRSMSSNSQTPQEGK
jgi:hypothetical protein